MCGGDIGKLFVPVRDAVESAASLAGNYLLPGSSIVTDNLVSKGSQNQLNSTLGKIAQIGTGAAGGGFGSSFTGIPAASDIGAGWTSAANGVGNLVGAGNVGTSVSNSLSSLLSGTGLGSGAVPSGTVPASFPSPSIASASSTPSLVDANSALTNSGASALTKGVGISAGGGNSSFSNLASLLGGAYSLYTGDEAKKNLTDAGNQALADVAPYTKTGAAANSKLSEMLGTGTNTGAADYGSLVKPFTPGDLSQDPGYQFDLQQGQQALDRQQAAKGDYFSGAALKEAQQFGQGLADNTYNNAFSRDQTQKQQTYSDVAGQAGAGQAAAATAGNITENIGNAKANAGISTSNQINSLLSSLLSGSGAKRPVNVGGQVMYI